MRWKALVAMAALSGCVHSTGGKVGVGLVAVGATSGFVYGVACADYASSDHNCESTGANVLGFAILGAIIGGVAIAIVSEHHYKPPAVPEPTWGPPPSAPPGAPAAWAGPPPADAEEPGAASAPALYEPIQARDPMARQLTLQAHRAATQGQCAGVPAAAARVQELDAEYYARVFAPDAAIARCAR